MAAAEQTLCFYRMTEAQLRQWVDASPGRVNDYDVDGWTPLCAATCQFESLPLVVWLLDVKGADVNTTMLCGYTPLYLAPSLEILTALLDRGGDPTLPTDKGSTVLMIQSRQDNVKNVARLLHDPRVRATINVQDEDGYTALHIACKSFKEAAAISIIPLLFHAGANPALTDNKGETPFAYLHPTHHTAIALLEQYPDAQKASLFVKARRLAAVSRNGVAPSYLQGRVARGQPLPCVQRRRVVLTPVEGGHVEEDEEDGPQGEGMPRDVFRVVLDLLMPTWDPLRRKNAGAAGATVLRKG